MPSNNTVGSFILTGTDIFAGTYVAGVWHRFLSELVAVSKEENNLPQDYFLSQNYPNPFNPTTIINFKLLHRDKVILNVYDIMGRHICTLLNEDKLAGQYSLNFDSKKFSLSSGIYFYRLITNQYSAGKKMILLK